MSYLTLYGDGLTWDLLNSSVQIRGGAGLGGLFFPKVERFGRSTPARDGRRSTGFRIPERPLVLPLTIGADDVPLGPEQFEAMEASFVRMFHPGKTVELGHKLDSAGSVERRLTLALNPDGDDPFEFDPFQRMFRTSNTQYIDGYDIDLNVVAEDPYWYGPEQGSTFAAVGNGQTLFNNGAGGPPFIIQPGSVVGSQSIANPGDVAASPLYELLGPFDAFRIVLGGFYAMSATISVPTGGRIVLDTSPYEKSATQFAPGSSTGTPITHLMNEWDFAAVQPGASVSVDISLSGSGSAAVKFKPRYYRAWG